MPTLGKKLVEYAFHVLLDDYCAEICFAVFQEHELARQACVHCKEHCRVYGRVTLLLLTR